MPLETIYLQSTNRQHGHPWVDSSHFTELAESIADGQSVGLVDANGQFLGCGVLDRGDSCAVWKRYTYAEDIAFDEAYIAGAIVDSIDRRGEESCQRLVSSDADYLPGLTVELFSDVVWLSCETTATREHCDLIADIIKERIQPSEVVIDIGNGPMTHSGKGLKGRWIEVDGLFYRIDLLNTAKPRFFLDQREQHVLVGSLCEGRVFLDAFSHSGAFAMQAARGGASSVVALDVDETFSKAIQANTQRNECFLETVCDEAGSYLYQSEAGSFDGIVLDPPAGVEGRAEDISELNRLAFAALARHGLLATYCRSVDLSAGAFEQLVAGAAAQVGREARVFARTSQPFDFPMLLNFPESVSLKGLILEVF